MNIEEIFNDVKELLIFRYENGIIVTFFKKSLSIEIRIKIYIK